MIHHNFTSLSPVQLFSLKAAHLLSDHLLVVVSLITYQLINILAVNYVPQAPAIFHCCVSIFFFSLVELERVSVCY